MRSAGTEVSIGALSGFLAWRRLKAQMEKNELVVEELMAGLPERKPDLTEEEVSGLGQVFFAALALEQQDPKGWYLAQRTGIRKAALRFMVQKYKDTCEMAKAEVAKLKDVDHPPTQEETLAIVDHLDRILGFK